MPIAIDVDHEARLVRSVASGQVTFDDAWSYHEALVLADALTYAKLVDATEATFVLDDREMMLIGARVSAYGNIDNRGPVAVVVRTPAQRGTLRRYFNLVGGAFAGGLFETELEAQDWLRAQAGRS